MPQMIFVNLSVADLPRSMAFYRALGFDFDPRFTDDTAGVDALTGAAPAAGGTESRPAQDYGFMYSRAFADPDGHIWEPMWMDMEAATQAMGKG